MDKNGAVLTNLTCYLHEVSMTTKYLITSYQPAFVALGTWLGYLDVAEVRFVK